MAKKIIDISTYQKNCNYDKMASNVDGAILRIGYTGYGTNKPSKDAMFETHYRELHKRGVPIGVYYFTLAQSDAMAEEEALWVLKEVADKEISLPIYIDAEEQKKSVGWTNLNKKQRSQYVARFCEVISKANYFVGVYASKSWFTNILDSQVDPYSKWVAQYAAKCTYAGNYAMWQYTSSGSGTDHGADTRVDLSEAYMDFEQIIRERGLNNLKMKEEVKEEPSNIDKVASLLEEALKLLKG